jgi:hypothetical protein
VNENSRLSTALFEEAITNVLTECVGKSELIHLRLIVALAEWALAKMGDESQHYTKRAMEEFVIETAKIMFAGKRDVASALRETPLVIPRRRPGNEPSMYQFLREDNLLQIREEYEDLCNETRDLKTKNKTDATSFRRALKKILNGPNQDWISDVELTDEPSDIVTLYLTKKHRRLRIKPEMLKKRLADAAHLLGLKNIKDRRCARKLINKRTGLSVQ